MKVGGIKGVLGVVALACLSEVIGSTIGGYVKGKVFTKTVKSSLDEDDVLKEFVVYGSEEA